MPGSLLSGIDSGAIFVLGEFLWLPRLHPHFSPPGPSPWSVPSSLHPYPSATLRPDNRNKAILECPNGEERPQLLNPGAFFMKKESKNLVFGGSTGGSYFFYLKKQGLDLSSNPLFLFVVAGLGFEPRTFGL